MNLPLWLKASTPRRNDDGRSVTVDLQLARCRNCGKVKALSDPCGFDHLAAIMALPKRDRDA